MKVITTRSGVAYEGPSIPTNPSPKKVVERETEETTDKVQNNFQGSTAHIQPPVIPIPISEPDVSKTLPKPNIPYPSRLNDQKFYEKALNQIEKIFHIRIIEMPFGLLVMPPCKNMFKGEKYHFMVKEGIVLGHMVSSAGLEVDKAKINVILKLPPPTNIKGIRSFLRHAGFYRHFIKDFSKIARPLPKLLKKDTPFKFNDECQKAFESLKEKLTCAPVIVSPNWNLPFELMCDASDFA
ncbi:reverse transcriptase domain-containing protein [Tanacetum coccineum]